MDLAEYLPNVYENNVAKNQEVNLLKNDFGDGYAQVAPDGMNHIQKEYTVTIPAVTRFEKLILDDFFIDRGGYKNFTWTPPGDSTERLWKCESWNFAPVAPEYFLCKFVIKEDFSLGEDI